MAELLYKKGDRVRVVVKPDMEGIDKDRIMCYQYNKKTATVMAIQHGMYRLAFDQGTIFGDSVLYKTDPDPITGGFEWCRVNQFAWQDHMLEPA